MLKCRAMGLAAAILLATAAPSVADRFPDQPITIIVPTPPGGGVDIVHRLLGELAEPVLGAKVVVMNRPGAAGTIGLTAVARARPDGYTLGAVWNAPLTIAPHTLSVPYDTSDFAPVMQTTGGTPLIFCVRPDFPATTGQEFMAYARRHPGALSYGNDGVGGLVQLAGERLFRPLGLSLLAVPFGGAAETLRNFLGGHIDIYGGTIPVIATQLREGKATCLISTTAGPVPELPGAASAADFGLADQATELWRGLVAPKGTPADRLEILAEAFRKAAQDPRFQDYLQKNGETGVFGTPEDFRRMVLAESAAFAELVRELGLGRR